MRNEPAHKSAMPPRIRIWCIAAMLAVATSFMLAPSASAQDGANQGNAVDARRRTDSRADPALTSPEGITSAL
jgi:hypothetical protein